MVENNNSCATIVPLNFIDGDISLLKSEVRANGPLKLFKENIEVNEETIYWNHNDNQIVSLLRICPSYEVSNTITLSEFC